MIYLRKFYVLSITLENDWKMVNFSFILVMKGFKGIKGDFYNI